MRWMNMLAQAVASSAVGKTSRFSEASTCNSRRQIVMLDPALAAYESSPTELRAMRSRNGSAVTVSDRRYLRLPG